MNEFRPNPKPEPKEKKQFGLKYWNDIRKKSMQKAMAKKQGSGVSDKLDKWYHVIAELSDNTCAETGRKLEFSKKHCLHLLPKSKYPYFATDIRNGLYASWSVHSIVDKGSPAQRKNLKIWEYISLTRKMLLEEVGLTYSEEHWLSVTY